MLDHGPAVNQRQDQVVKSAVVANVVKHDHVGMVHARHDPRLVEGLRFRIEDLQRNRPLEFAIVSGEHDPVRATAEDAIQLEAPEHHRGGAVAQRHRAERNHPIDQNLYAQRGE